MIGSLSVKNQKSIKTFIFELLTENPDITLNNLKMLFPEINTHTLSVYYYDWKTRQKQKPIIKHTTHSCLNCGKTFKPKRLNHKFCSKTCCMKYTSQLKNKKPKKCSVCGKQTKYLNRNQICHTCEFNYGSVYVLDMKTYEWKLKKTKAKTLNELKQQLNNNIKPSTQNFNLSQNNH